MKPMSAYTAMHYLNGSQLGQEIMSVSMADPSIDELIQTGMGMGMDLQMEFK